MIAGIFVRLTNVDELDLIGINEPLGLFGTNACKGFLLVGFHLASLPNGALAPRMHRHLLRGARRRATAARRTARTAPASGGSGRSSGRTSPRSAPRPGSTAAPTPDPARAAC